MTDRVPGAPGQYIMTVSASEAQKILTGEAVSVTLVRDDQPLVEGTPYNKQSVLPDDLAARICPNVVDPSPADAFAGLLSDIIDKTLLANGWSSSAPYKQIISVTKDNSGVDITENHAPKICLLPDDDEVIREAQTEAWNCIGRAFTGDKTITFICYEDKPGTDIPLQIEVRP